MDTGSMSLFYASCDSVHREFFSALLFDWQDSGQLAEPAAAENDMQVEPGAMLLRVRSVGRSDQSESGSILMPCLFALHAGGGADRARISLNLKNWREWFGPETRDLFVSELKGIQGLQHRSRADDFAILEPAHLSGPTQQKLRDLMVDFGRNSREILGL
jgi:hypothetical protein